MGLARGFYIEATVALVLGIAWAVWGGPLLVGGKALQGKAHRKTRKRIRISSNKYEGRT